MKQIKLHKVARLGLTKENSISNNVAPNEFTSERYDFLPVVKINKTEEPKNAIISLKECTTHTKSKLNLGSDYDEEHREYIVADIVIAKNSTARIPLMVKRGYDPWGFQNDDGVLDFKSSNGSIKMNFIDNDDTDYREGEDKYDLNNAENGDELVLEITAKALSRGNAFSISVYASDNKKYGNIKSKRKALCGKFNIKVIENDVFMEEERELVIRKNEELVGNDKVCFRVADKALSNMFDNKKLVLNSYANENSYTRMKSYKKLGYVKEEKIFDQFIYKGGGNYEPTEYSKSNKLFFSYFSKQIKSKLGYHIYYFSMVKGYHVLLLIIDNTDPCNVKFKILDQIRIRKEDSFDNIDKEMLRLTNVLWNSALNNTGVKYNTESAIWKIER
ncbi:hypothetical protein [Yeosuana marina]|uniref:hypothetical protein n=1 Tax=Yeosuana marina TaxID=1565536 RepID=UPI0030C7BA3E